MLKAGFAIMSVLLMALLMTWFLVRTSGPLTDDSWWTPTDLSHLTTSDEVPFSVVTTELRQASCRRLEDVSIVQLTDNEALRMTGGKKASKVGKPFLVRALAIKDNDTWVLLVYYRELKLYVVAGALGGPPLRTERAPVVVWLQEEPLEVFVDLSTAR